MTIWEYEDNGDRFLVYEGSLEELADETGYALDVLTEALAEYEDASRDLIDTEREIKEAWQADWESIVRDRYYINYTNHTNNNF